MKICVTYPLNFNLDVPKEEIKEILSTTKEQGAKFERLIQKYISIEDRNILEKHLIGDIMGIYNTYERADDGTYELTEQDFDEVIYTP